MRASIVVPTRDRSESLLRLTAALARQVTDESWELIIVDDSDDGSLTSDLGVHAPTTILRTGGAGPARARNAGWRAASAPLVLFTDDDTEPAPQWVDAAIRWIDGHPSDAGVEGRVVSPEWDPFYAMSVTSDGPGGYLTANIAYSRAILEQLDGFCEDFPYPHGEDYDLAFRVLEVGPIGFEAAMEVLHHPREMTARQIMRRGRFVPSEILLLRRHPERYGRMQRLPAPLFPIVTVTTTWATLARADHRSWVRSPKRALRWAALYLGSLVNAVVAAFGRPAASRASSRDR